ncbi:hypothetical protein [[Mycoplasma] testudinis]|uniref:hypothetical protein n=1 Tax=[Mycoplasma] testudinis TaxID=33924 RepID=UPI000480F929|nr:hypothetical protein [[Mycoplasma] testudinis]
MRFNVFKKYLFKSFLFIGLFSVAVPLAVFSNSNVASTNLHNNDLTSSSAIKSNEEFLKPITDLMFSKDTPGNKDKLQKDLDFGKNAFINEQGTNLKEYLNEQEVSLAFYNATVYYRTMFPEINLIPTLDTADNNDAATAFFRSLQNQWYRLANHMNSLYFVGYSPLFTNLLTKDFLQEHASKYGWIYNSKNSKIVDSFVFNQINGTQITKAFYFMLSDYSVFRIDFVTSSNNATFTTIDPVKNSLLNSLFSIHFEPQVIRIFDKNNTQIKPKLGELATLLQNVNLSNRKLTDEKKQEMLQIYEKDHGTIMSYVLFGVKND